MFNKKKKMIFYFLFILFTILFLWNAFSQRDHMITLYETGIDKIKNQEYQEAQEILSELGEYKDSFDKIKIAQILEQQKELCDRAIAEFDSKNYENAIELFKQIEDFKASEEYLKNYEYNIELFKQIDGFEDSKAYIEKANNLLKEKNNNEFLYNEAYSYYKSGNYILAIQYFSKLNGYKDSEETIQKCRLELAKLQQATTISAGIRYSTGIISDGMIKYSGDYKTLEEELYTWKNIISISLKGHLAIGLKKDGTVLVAGKIPDYPDYYIDTHTWKNIIAVSSGQQYIIGLESDGTLVAQGHNGDGQLNINDWENIVAISCGWRHTVGLDSNGNIHIAGYQSKSQLDNIEEHKSDWVDIIAISAAGGSSETSGRNAYTVGLKKDRTVVTTLSDEIQEKISKWSDIVAVSAGDFYIVGLKSNGEVVIEQIDNSVNLDNSIEEIDNWTDIVAISAGRGFTLGIKSNGEVIASGFDKNHQIDIDDWGEITHYKDEWNSIFDENLRWKGNK